MTIPILSLVVAALAVFVGPIISWAVAKRQIQSSLAATNKQIVAPMRQAWINSLRDLLAELTSRALHYYVAGFEERKDEEYQQLTLLEHKIALMLNAQEEDHKELEALIRSMISALEQGRAGGKEFERAHQTIMPLSRRILKREWNRVKDKIAGPCDSAESGGASCSEGSGGVMAGTSGGEDIQLHPGQRRWERRNEYRERIRKYGWMALVWVPAGYFALISQLGCSFMGYLSAGALLIQLAILWHTVVAIHGAGIYSDGWLSSKGGLGSV